MNKSPNINHENIFIVTNNFKNLGSSFKKCEVRITCKYCGFLAPKIVEYNIKL